MWAAPKPGCFCASSFETLCSVVGLRWSWEITRQLYLASVGEWIEQTGRKHGLHGRSSCDHICRNVTTALCSHLIFIKILCLVITWPCIWPPSSSDHAFRNIVIDMLKSSPHINTVALCPYLLQIVDGCNYDKIQADAWNVITTLKPLFELSDTLMKRCFLILRAFLNLLVKAHYEDVVSACIRVFSYLPVSFNTGIVESLMQELWNLSYLHQSEVSWTIFSHWTISFERNLSYSRAGKICMHFTLAIIQLHLLNDNKTNILQKLGRAVELMTTARYYLICSLLVGSL